MLVNINQSVDPQMNLILSVIGQGGVVKNVEQGIYLSNSFSFGNTILENKNEYFDFGEHGSYGVCDNIEQVKEKYGKWLNSPNIKFCVSFTKVEKSKQSESGGWRWHKWGEYIGTKTPQFEYLYDEGDDITEVYCYHIYNIL